MNKWSFHPPHYIYVIHKCFGNDWGWGEEVGEGTKESVAKNTDSKVQMAAVSIPISTPF